MICGVALRQWQTHVGTSLKTAKWIKDVRGRNEEAGEVNGDAHPSDSVSMAASRN